MSTSISGTGGITFNDASVQNTAATGFGFKNRIINGAMMIDQRNAGASVTPTTTADGYPVDRTLVGVTQNSKLTCQQSTTAPAGFSNSLLVTSSSAYAVAAGDIFYIQQKIEGFNTADLAFGTASASSVTLSFWVRSSLTGTFGGALANSASNRSYPFSYTISAANTWEQKSITVAGDTTGTWIGATNGIGLRVIFGLGGGSTYSGTAGSWAAANYLTATGATSVVGTSGATFYITGVQLEKGSTATSFDYRPYGTELALCQRYYYKIVGTSVGAGCFGVGFAGSTTAAPNMTFFPVTMRIAPTALEQSGTASDYRVFIGSGITCSAVPTINSNSGSQAAASTQAIVASGLTAGQGTYLQSLTTNAYLAWSAEL